MFERRLVGTDKLDEFVRAVNQGANAEEAFAKLVGQSAGDFKTSFHEWVKKLPADRSLLEPLPKDKKP
jgi:hypothetical protein